MARPLSVLPWYTSWFKRDVKPCIKHGLVKHVAVVLEWMKTVLVK